MRKILFSLIILAALTFEAGAQWLRPAREIRVETNGWTYIPTSKTNAQLVINWLDAELGRVSLTGGFTVLPDTNNLQVLMEWIDDNWNTNAVPTLTFLAGAYMKGTNIIGATFTNNQWSIPASAAGISTSGWSAINPAGTNVQAALDAINAFAGYANSNLNVESVAGSAKLAYNNGYGISGAYVPSNNITANGFVVWTNGLSGALAGNTNVLYWGTGTDNGKLFINKAGSYLYYMALSATAMGPAYTFAYAVHYRGTNDIGSAPISGMYGGGAGNGSSGAGVYIAMDAEPGDYIVVKNFCLGATTNHIILGSQYVFAYKIYNSD